MSLALPDLSDMDFAPAPSPSAVSISRRRKAAVIVQILLSDGGKLALKQMPEKSQELLAKELANIRLVDRETVNSVVEEFIEILSAIGLSSPGGASAALEALGPHISPELAERLREQMDQPHGQDPWTTLLNLTVSEIAEILESESNEVAAVFVSKMPVDKAATVLAAIPGELARRITLAINRTSSVAPSVVSRIGSALVQEHCQVRVPAFPDPATDRVGAILNSGTSVMRDGVLQGLDSGEDGDELFATGVRKRIFTYIDIPDRIEKTDVPAILRVVSAEDLAKAIAFSVNHEDLELKNTAEFILSNMSQRMAQQVRENADELGVIPPDEGEPALNVITNALREEADAGNIKFIEKKDDEN